MTAYAVGELDCSLIWADISASTRHSYRHHNFAPGTAPWWVTLSIGLRHISHKACGPLWANTKSSTKPEVHCCPRRIAVTTDVQKISWSLACRFWATQADKQTQKYRHVHRKCLQVFNIVNISENDTYIPRSQTSTRWAAPSAQLSSIHRHVMIHFYPGFSGCHPFVPGQWDLG